MPEAPYDMLGGDAKVRALVDRFYDLMDSVPEYYVIRKLHPADLAGSREKLYLFLSGWLGGPPLYSEKFGHPMLRARHLPFAIGPEDRDHWVAAMTAALAPLNTALQTAQTNLATASLRNPPGSEAIRAASEEVGKAQAALAQARADQLAKIQNSPNKLNAEQVAAVGQANGVPAPARGGGGRGAAGAPAERTPPAAWMTPENLTKLASLKRMFNEAGVSIYALKNIGGNQGDAVSIAGFPRKDFTAFRWPKNYSKAGLSPLPSGFSRAALNVSPVLMERYLDAADAVITTALAAATVILPTAA